MAVAAAPGADGAHAEVLRMNTPALGLTFDRIGALPDDERPAWQAYLERSQAQMKADRAALAAEL
ncbi:MAG TPA: pectate lyase, partial [Brevundimonas sp.]|nr:pectate lyase [Brevundimonas sp.]